MGNLYVFISNIGNFFGIISQDLDLMNNYFEVTAGFVFLAALTMNIGQNHADLPAGI